MWAIAGSAEEPADTVFTELEEVEVVATPGSAMLRREDGSVRISTQQLLLGARSFGEADIINSLRQLPGVASSSDYSSGLSIDGSPASSTAYLLDGAPVYFPYRFGGIFSTFNTPHFSHAIFERQGTGASVPGRTGAYVSLESDLRESDRTISGTANAGIIASSATVRYAPVRALTVAASARVSYVNPLYGDLLNGHSTAIFYDFADLNLSLAFRPDPSSTVKASIFYSNDRLCFKDYNYVLDTKLDWSNLAASLSWSRQSRHAYELTAYFSRFGGGVKLQMPQLQVNAPSVIGSAGLKGRLNLSDTELLTVDLGGETIWHNIEPQSVRVSGSVNNLGAISYCQEAFDGRLYAQSAYNLRDWLTISGGLSLHFWVNGDYRVVKPDPRVSVIFRHDRFRLRWSGGRYSQFLHHTGFSEIGLSSDFWCGATGVLPGQDAWCTSLTLTVPLDFYGMEAEAEVYFKRLTNQPEYEGMLLEIVDVDYDALSHITMTYGYNYGAYFSLRRNVGAFTGALSLSWGTAVRYMPGYAGWVRAATDPGLALHIVSGYNLGSRWTFNASFRLSSGRPYTPAHTIYIVAGALVSEYGVRNSARLPLYHRLDLSATYHFRHSSTTSVRHMLNFSLINALGHGNAELQYFVVNRVTGEYQLKRVNSIYRLMPSISYTIQF